MGISVKHFVGMLFLFSMLTLNDSSNIAHGEVGAFRTCYRFTTGLPGAPTLVFKGVVSNPNKTSHGVGHLSWTVSPPVNEELPMHGHFMQNGKEIKFHAVGSKPGAMMSFLLILPDGWGKPGKAHFRWYANNKFGNSSELVPAKPCED